MKYTSTLALLLTVSTAVAQEGTQHFDKSTFMSGRADAIVNNILQQQATSNYNASAKTTATQRLLARTSTTTGQPTSDSTHFFYSTPLRGAFHDPKNPWSYQDFFRPVVWSPSHGGNDGYFFGRQYIQHDSALWYRFSGSTKTVMERTTSTYDASNRPLQHTVKYEAPFDSQRFRYTFAYDGNGLDTFCQRAVDTGTSNTPFPARTINQYSTYDAAGRVLVDAQVNGLGQPGIKYVYTYDSIGRLVQIDEVEPTAISDLRCRINYNTAGLVEKVFFEENNGLVWYPWHMDSLGYSGSNPSYIHWGSYGSTIIDPTLRLNYKMEAQLNGAGDWDTLRHYVYYAVTATWTFDRQEAITYNTAGNWDRRYFYGDANNDNVPDAQPAGHIRYYYDLWGSSAAVSDLPKATVFHLYPNPTSGTLQVEWNIADAVTPAYYRVSDASGRTVSKGNIAQSSSRVDLSLDNLPAGLYIFFAMDKHGTVLHREKVIRQ